MAEKRANVMELEKRLRDKENSTPFLPRWQEELPFKEAVRAFVWDMFESPEESRLARNVNVWVMSLVIASAVISVVETVPPWYWDHKSLWEALETFFVLNFTLEFACRLSCTPDYHAFVQTLMNWIDLIAILPYWIDIFVMLVSGEKGLPNISFIRILRLGRCFRLVKLGRYSPGLVLVQSAIVNSMDALQLFMFLLVLVTVICSSAMYFMERGEYTPPANGTCAGTYYRSYLNGYRESFMPELFDPDCWTKENASSLRHLCEKKPSPFQSIPHTFWWSIVTLTTVGYGEQVPITYTGQFMGAVTVISGTIVLALPLSIISTSFIEARDKQNAEAHAERELIEAMEKKLAVTPLTDEAHKTEHFIDNIQGCMSALQSSKTGLADIMAQATDALEIIRNMRSSTVQFSPDAPMSVLFSDDSKMADNSASILGRNNNGARVQPAPEEEKKGVHPDWFLPKMKGSTMTGKEYLVEKRTMVQLCTLLLATLRQSVKALQHVDGTSTEHWNDATSVVPVQQNNAGRIEPFDLNE